MSSKNSTDSVKNICDVIGQRQLEIFQKEVKTKYVKNLIEKIKNETEDMKKKSVKMKLEAQLLSERNKDLRLVCESLQNGRNVFMKCLLNYQTLEELLAKDLTLKIEESNRIEQHYKEIYESEKKKVSSNPLYQELRNKKIEFLKMDIKFRQCQVAIQKQKRINKQILEIKKKIFYRFFINLATKYLNQHKLNSIQNLKIEHNNKVKQVNEFYDSINLTKDIETTKLKPREPDSLSKKITEILENEPEEEEIPAKVHILNQQIIVPAFEKEVEIKATEPKRKMKKVNIFRRWHQMIEKKQHSESKNCSQDVSICSEDNRISDNHQLPLDTGRFSQNTDLNKSSLQSQDDKKQEANISESGPEKYQDNKLEVLSVNTHTQAIPASLEHPVSSQNKIVRFSVEEPQIEKEEPVLDKPFFGRNIFGSMFNNSAFQDLNAERMNADILNVPLPGNISQNNPDSVFNNASQRFQFSPEYSYDFGNVSVTEKGDQTTSTQQQVQEPSGSGGFFFGNSFNPFERNTM